MNFTDNARFVPLPSVTKQDFEQLADAQKWKFFEEHPAEMFTPYEKLWYADETEETLVYWIENELMSLRYIIIAGPAFQEVGDVVSKNIGHYDAAKIEVEWKAAKGNPEKLLGLLRTAAFAADSDKFDPAYFKFFEEAFNDPAVEMKRGALMATGGLRWTELNSWYQKFAQDSDEMVKAMADQALELAESNTPEAKKARWTELNRNCLGLTFRGDFGPAIQNGIEAAKLALSTFGDESMELADSNKNLACAYFYARTIPEKYARSVIERAREIAENHLDTDPNKASEILHQYAVILHGYKDYAKAEVYYKKALDIRRTKGIGDNVIAKSLGDMARLYGEMGKAEEAEKIAGESRDLLAKYLEAQTDKTSDDYYEALYDHAIASNNIGYTHENKKEYDVAAKDYTNAVTSLEGCVKLGGRIPDGFRNNVRANVESLRSSWASGIDDLDELLNRLDELSS